MERETPGRRESTVGGDGRNKGSRGVKEKEINIKKWERGEEEGNKEERK